MVPGTNGHCKDHLEQIDQQIQEISDVGSNSGADAETSPSVLYPEECLTDEAPQVSLVVPKSTCAGEAPKGRMKVAGSSKVTMVRCYYCITSQKLPFQSLAMNPTGEGWYDVSIIQ